MEKRTLGSSGLEVSAIGLGCMTITGGYSTTPNRQDMREAAERYGVDRSTVVTACRTAKQGALGALAAAVPGRSGMTAEQAALADARAVRA
jgi:hypothetical protein